MPSNTIELHRVLRTLPTLAQEKEYLQPFLAKCAI